MTTLLHHCTALLLDEAGTVLKNAFVLLDGTKIAAVGGTRPAGTFDREIDCGGDLLLPGFVNAHTHLPMTLMRGYGGGVSLQSWLEDYIFPAEAKLDERAVRAGTKLALAELIAAGVTCVADMYDFCGAICDEVVKAGLSGNIARGTTLFTPDFDPATNRAVRETEQLIRDWHGYHDGQILVDVSIHGEYTSRAALWETMAGIARQNGLGMHVHVSETRAEQEACLARHGKTPLAVLDDYGVWDTRAIAAHCVHTTPADWALMARKGITAVHNPVSNLKLGSGIAPVPAMRAAGVRVALGTDGASSNNSLDMLEELRFAAVLHNGAACDPLALLPLDALRMATADGAKALGRETGRIAPGCMADLILVNTQTPHMLPCHSPLENLVYAAKGSDVRMNIARGAIIYRDGAHLTVDVEAARREVIDYGLPLLFGDA